MIPVFKSYREKELLYLLLKSLNVQTDRLPVPGTGTAPVAD
jgi:hypothetical protein